MIKILYIIHNIMYISGRSEKSKDAGDDFRQRISQNVTQMVSYAMTLAGKV